MEIKLLKFLFILVMIPNIVKTQTCESLNKIGEELGKNGEYNKAIIYFYKALKKNYTSSILKGTIYNNLGLCNYYKGDYSSALENYLLSEKIRKKLNDSIGLSKVLLNLGALFNTIEDDKNAIKYYHESYEIKKALKDTLGMLIILNNKGKIYCDFNDIKSSQKYLNLAHEIAKKNDDSLQLCKIFINIGNNFFKLGNLSQANKYYDKAALISIKKGFKQDFSISLNNIAEIYFSKGFLKEADSIYHLSLQIAKEINDKRGTAINYLNIGKLYRTLDVEKSLATLKNAIILFEELKIKSKLVESLEIITQCYARLGKMDSAYHYANKQLILLDNITDEDKRDAVKKIIAIEKYKSRIHDFQVRNIFQSQMIYKLYMILFLIILVFILSIIIIFNFRKIGVYHSRKNSINKLVINDIKSVLVYLMNCNGRKNEEMNVALNELSSITNNIVKLTK